MNQLSLLPVDPGISQTDILTRPGRVLVVEDQRHLARFLQYVLERAGYEVSVAYDGEQALAGVDGFRPDAVVLDLVLPGISGLQVVRRLRADRKNKGLVILVLTPAGHPGIPAEVRQAGADSCFGKPIAPSSLLQKLAEYAVLPRLGQAVPLASETWR